MKKLVVFLFLALGAVGMVHAQTNKHVQVQREKHYPVLPYNENGYTVHDLDTFMFNPGPLHASYREKFLTLINKALYESGEYVNVNDGKPLTKYNIGWILSHMKTVTRKYQNFTNSYQSYDQTAVEFYEDNESTPFVGPCHYFFFRSCGLVTDKVICINLLDVGFERIPFNETPTQLPPTETFTQQQVPTRLPSYVETPVSTTKDSVVITHGISTLGVAGIVVGTGGLAYLIFHHKKDAGGPGGAPKTPGDTGGPGGAPPTTSVYIPTQKNLSFGFGISKHGFSLGGVFRF